VSARDDRAPEPGRGGHRPFERLKELAHSLPPGPPAAPAGPTSPEPASAPTGAAPQRTYPGRVTVRRERKGRGGKAVTIAEGPGLAGHPLERHARDVGRALGTGARVEGGTLVVQGEQVERLAAWLELHGWSGVVRGN
jgi:translation initiation factor 1